ncbi:MAG: hypothetical protein Q9211_004921, partial [Gyalolechia sp. 1 TL-2023]
SYLHGLFLYAADAPSPLKASVQPDISTPRRYKVNQQMASMRLSAARSATALLDTEASANIIPLGRRVQDVLRIISTSDGEHSYDAELSPLFLDDGFVWSFRRHQFFGTCEYPVLRTDDVQLLFQATRAHGPTSQSFLFD